MKFEGEIIIKVSLNDITKKLKIFVLKNTENLFGSDWFQKFNLWDQPINTFCQKVECITGETEKIKMELKGSFPEVFSAGHGKCTKIKAKFHRYLHGWFFTLQTDHEPLITIFGSKKGLQIYTANRLLRWVTILLNYNFKIEYLPSKQISHADGLSRLVPKYIEPFEDTLIAALRTDCEFKNMIANTIKQLPVTLLEIKSEAMNDDFITNIKQKITVKKRKSTRSIFTMWQCPPI